MDVGRHFQVSNARNDVCSILAEHSPETLNRKGFNGGPTCATALVGGLSLFCHYDVITPFFSLDWEQLFHHSCTLSSRY